jgi:lysine/ornithine N-monooxygenase
MANYWDQWKQLVLYQVSDNYRPQSSGAAATACGVTGTCLSINGSGNPNAGSGSYRAAVIMAGKKLTNITPAQTRAAQSASEYLELNNKTNRTDAPSNLALDTYKPSDASYSTVNDLVQCVDGKTKCE